MTKKKANEVNDFASKFESLAHVASKEEWEESVKNEKEKTL